MCIDIVEIRFWIAKGIISSIFDKLSARHTIVVGYYQFTILACLYKSTGVAISASALVKVFSESV